MRAAILGVGRMGTAIAWAMREFGFDVVCVDADHDAGDKLKLVFGDNNFVFYRTKHIEEDLEEIFKYDEPDVVISSLPYRELKSSAKICIDRGYRYCDLGGRVDASQQINEHATRFGERPVMTDLGLAPGWINILAEQGCRRVSNATDVSMMVGGLPDYLQSARNVLRYTSTWSVDGLINEYKDDCLVLQDGEIETVKSMEGWEHVETKHHGVLEAFYTSGGAAHSIKTMKSRGVRNCSYKTLRYPGHRDIVKFLIRDCELDDKALKQIFVNGTRCKETIHDVVVMRAEVSNKNSGLSWKKEIVVKSDTLQHASSFSAMQKATAFPTASVARIMAEGHMEGKKEQHRDYWTNYTNCLTYADVPFDRLTNYLKELNLEV